MAHDELDTARRFQAELRALVKRYPGLTTQEAQARLSTYLRTQTDNLCIHTPRKEEAMPAKDQRTLGEDLVLVTVRLPQSALAFIDQHTETLRRQNRWMKIGRSDALRDLILRAIDALENPLSPPVATAPPPAPVEPDETPAPAYETRVLTPDLEPEPPPVAHSRPRSPALDPMDIAALEDMPLEPTAVTQESAVPDAQTEDIRPARSRRTARPTGNHTAPIKPKRASRAQKGD